MIPYGRHDITQSDIDAVVQVLKSDFLTQGPKIPHFEQSVAKRVRAKYGIAVNSATSALHIACLALGLSEGDWLWTTPITFVASANCGLYCRANIDFIDIDPDTYNLSVTALEEKLVQAEFDGRLPKVVVAVHLAGQPCDMQSIHELSLRYGFRIIEDASHAIGGSYQGEPIGNCRYSDITVFSFHPVKIITTAEGGMAVTNDDKLNEQMRLLRGHGITREPEQMEHQPDGPWYYEQIRLGFNYRMTDIQAALGLNQLERLQLYVDARHRLAAQYDDVLSELPLRTPFQAPDSYSARHLYIIRLNLDKQSKTRLQVFEELRNSGIGVNLHYIPVYRQPWFAKMGFCPEQFPQAESYYSEAISIPLYATMTDNDLITTVTALKKALIS